MEEIKRWHVVAPSCELMLTAVSDEFHPVMMTAVSDEAHPRAGRGLLRCDACHGASPLLRRTIPVTCLLAPTHKCQSQRSGASPLQTSAAVRRSSNAGGQVLALYISSSRHASGINRRPSSPRLFGSVQARSRCRPAAQTPAETCVCAWCVCVAAGGSPCAQACALVCVCARACSCMRLS